MSNLLHCVLFRVRWQNGVTGQLEVHVPTHCYGGARLGHDF